MLNPVPLNGGLNVSVDLTEIRNSAVATEFKNLILSEGGANVDRPALSSEPFANTGTSFGIEALTYFPVSNTLVAVDSDRRIWSITSAGAVTEITGIRLEGSSRPVFASDGTLLGIAGGGAPQTWSGTGVSGLMAGSPPDCKFLSVIDSYWMTHLIDDQEFRYAGPTAATRLVWDTSDFVSAEGLSDDVKAQAVLLRELYAFGSDSIEIFQNFGDSSTPFRRTFFIDRGISAPNSIVQADNSLFWLDSDRRFVRMVDRTPVEVSAQLAKYLRRLDTVDDCWGARIDIDGAYLIAWTFPTEGKTFTLDYKKGEWSEWDGFSSGLSARFKMHSYAFASPWNKHFVGDPTSGKIYELSFDNKTDGSDPLRRVRTSGLIDHGTGGKKRSNHYLIHVKRGVGTPGDEEPILQMRVNDDNEGWSEYVDIPLGFPGEKLSPIRVDGLRGIYSVRQIEIRMTDPAELIVTKLEEDVEALQQ